MSAFRLDPSLIEQLTQQVRPASPPMPHGGPILLDREGCIWVPSTDPNEAAPFGLYVHPGLRLAWVPVFEAGGVILIQLGGPKSDPDFVEDGVAAFLTRPGLQAMIADLSSIEAKLDGDAASLARMGVTDNARLLLGYIGGSLMRQDERNYDFVEVDVDKGWQTVRHTRTGNTYRISVEQVEGIE